MRLPLPVLLPLLIILVNANRKLKILVHSYSGGFSHLAFQGRLADLLVEAGHEVVSVHNALSPLDTKVLAYFCVETKFRYPPLFGIIPIRITENFQFRVALTFKKQ